MKATTAIIIDTRRALKTGKFPIKLRVTFKGKQRYFPTNYSLSEEEFQTVMGGSPRGKNKEIRISLQALESRANDIISKLSIFGFRVSRNCCYQNNFYTTPFTVCLTKKLTA
jgi:hypothetical protein